MCMRVLGGIMKTSCLLLGGQRCGQFSGATPHPLPHRKSVWYLEICFNCKMSEATEYAKLENGAQSKWKGGKCETEKWRTKKSFSSPAFFVLHFLVLNFPPLHCLCPIFQSRVFHLCIFDCVCTANFSLTNSSLAFSASPNKKESTAHYICISTSSKQLAI